MRSELWAQQQNFQQLAIFHPSGTGTIIIFMVKHLELEVYTTNCVGNPEYLLKQFGVINYHQTKDYDMFLSFYERLIR